MNRFRKILLSQNNLAKVLGMTSFFGATKFNHHTEIIDDLSVSSVLILSPHPDDDVFGLGGVISKLNKKGTKISIAYFCDGSGGIPESNIKNLELRTDNTEMGSPIKHSDELVEERKLEAKKSLEILGEGEQVFFGYRDGKLASGSSAVRALSDLIKRVKPDIIFVPSFLDNHPDHRATNEILINAFSNRDVKTCIEHCETKIYAYEIWTPIFPNRIVNITDSIEIKKKAIEAHKSQLKSRKYDKAIIALNQYRAEINGISGYAEGFFVTTSEIYKKLYNKS